MLSLKFRDLVSNLEEAPRATLNLFQLEHTVEVNSFPKISDFIETFARCRRRFDCLSHCYYYTISSILEFAKIDSIDTSPMSTIYNFLLEVTDHGVCISRLNPWCSLFLSLVTCGLFFLATGTWQPISQVTLTRKQII